MPTTRAIITLAPRRFAACPLPGKGEATEAFVYLAGPAFGPWLRPGNAGVNL